MDTFFEQIVPIRKTAKTWAAFIGIWLAAAILVFIFAFILPQLMPIFMTIFLLLAFGTIYGAYKLCLKLSIEYEYIITNDTMDIDMIMAKSSRKRMASFSLKNVDRLEKYNPSAKPTGNFAKTIIACNENDPAAHLMVVTSEGKGNTLVVFAPDQRLQGAALKFLPKYIANSAFKD